MDKDKQFYRCPSGHCSFDARLAPSANEGLWICQRCFSTFWLVENLLDEKVFIHDTRKTKYTLASFLIRDLPSGDGEELPF